MARYKKGTKMKWYDWLAVFLLVISGLVHGLMTFGFNIIEALFDTGFMAKLIYALVGLSGLYGLWFLIKAVKMMMDN